MSIVLLGSLCIGYLALEIGLAARPAPSATFGVVDATTGRSLEVTLDRRVRSRRGGQR
jgi:hypothetical protein